jgi:hypothetical protein
MNHGTQLSPAESAAMWGTELLPAFCALDGLAPDPFPADALAWLPFCEEPPPEPPWELPPPLPLEALPVSEPLV